MYQAARGWGIQPSEFWQMSIGEWFAEAEVMIEKADNTPLPGMKHLTPKSVRELKDDLDLTDDEWWNKHGRNS